jgi:hypothetical protein
MPNRSDRLLAAALRVRDARLAGDWGAHAAALVALFAAGGASDDVERLLGPAPLRDFDAEPARVLVG